MKLVILVLLMTLCLSLKLKSKDYHLNDEEFELYLQEWLAMHDECKEENGGDSGDDLCDWRIDAFFRCVHS
jgi:hypothetical protein